MRRREAEWRRAMLAERQGDVSAYRDFLEAFAHAARRIAAVQLRRGDPALDPEDVVQEVLVAVHTHRRQWDPSRPLTPWLGAVLRYKIVDALRRAGRNGRGRVDLSEAEWAALPAGDAFDPDLPLEEVRRRLDELPPGQRAAIRAVALDGASYRQAAERLQTTEGALRVSLHRGLKSLARLLEREPGS